VSAAGRQLRCLSAFLLAFGLLAPHPARAQSAGTVVAGPFTATLPNSNLFSFSQSFNVPPPLAKSYIVRVALSAPNSLTSLSVKLNNTQVLSLADFAGGVTRVDKLVTLLTSNTLAVQVAGAKGTKITFTVFNVVFPKPTALSPNPLALTAGSSGTLTATLSPTPTAAGTLGVASGNTAVVTVPSSVSFASGQASVAIPVSARASGSVVITASANGGTASATVNVNAPPTVNITSPANGAVFAAPATITVTATAADSDGTVAKVDFFDSGTLVGTATAAPYTVTLANVAAGVHVLTARATDNLGAVTISAAATITVDTAPVVSLTAPANNAIFIAPATITLSASATDAFGNITKVDFFQGSTRIGTATAAPYNFVLSNVSPGSYSLTAVATNDAGTSSTSAPVAIVVNAPISFFGQTPKDVTLPGGTLPEIAASYTVQGSTINVASVALQLDGVNVTSQATVTASGVLYLVTQPLADGTHTVALSVGSANGGVATSTWSFTVDDPAPNFHAETPRDVFLVDRNPRIRVLLSGFNIVPSSVHISVDGADVTAQADIGVDHVVFVPVTPLVDGLHTVSVAATDGRGVTAGKQWGFTVQQPPAPPTTNDGDRTLQTVVPTINALP
jgi:hypothetical protein